MPLAAKTDGSETSVQVRQHLADDAVLVLLPLVEDEEVRLPQVTGKESC